MLHGHYSHIFQELFNFRVVFCLNLLLVKELFLLACMLCKLKTMAVKGVFILVSTNIVDNDALGCRGALVSVWLTVGIVLERSFLIFQGNSPNVIGNWGSSITGILVIVQLCSNIMFCNLCLLSERLNELAKCMARRVLNSSTSHDRICLHDRVYYTELIYLSK